MKLWALRQGDKVVWAGKYRPKKEGRGKVRYWFDALSYGHLSGSCGALLCRVEVKILKRL